MKEHYVSWVAFASAAGHGDKVAAPLCPSRVGVFRLLICALSPLLHRSWMEVQMFCRMSYPGCQILQFSQETRLFQTPSTGQGDPNIPAANHLQSPLDESAEGWADDPSLEMQQYDIVYRRESSEQFGCIRRFGGLTDGSCQICCIFTGLTS